MSIDRRLEAGLAVGDHKTSMLQDLEAGKPLETGCLIGAVLELGDRLRRPDAAHADDPRLPRATPARARGR